MLHKALLPFSRIDTILVSPKEEDVSFFLVLTNEYWGMNLFLKCNHLDTSSSINLCFSSWVSMLKQTVVAALELSRIWRAYINHSEIHFAYIFYDSLMEKICFKNVLQNLQSHGVRLPIWLQTWSFKIVTWDLTLSSSKLKSNTRH